MNRYQYDNIDTTLTTKERENALSVKPGQGLSSMTWKGQKKPKTGGNKKAEAKLQRRRTTVINAQFPGGKNKAGHLQHVPGSLNMRKQG